MFGYLLNLKTLFHQGKSDILCRGNTLAKEKTKSSLPHRHSWAFPGKAVGGVDIYMNRQLEIKMGKNRSR